MTITVLAKPLSHVESVERVDEATYTVYVTEPPHKGRANAAICRLLADFFDIAPSRVTIKSGHTSKTKRFVIDYD